MLSFQVLVETDAVEQFQQCGVVFLKFLHKGVARGIDELLDVINLVSKFNLNSIGLELVFKLNILLPHYIL